MFLADAAFIAGISGNSATYPFVFDLEVLNSGNHFDTTQGRYVVPYDGLYQFTVAFQAYDDTDLSFILEVDNEDVAFIKHFDNTQGRNSVIMTRNLHPQ